MPVAYEDYGLDISDEEADDSFIELKKNANRELFDRINRGEGVVYDANELFETPEKQEQDDENFRGRLNEEKANALRDVIKTDLVNDTIQFYTDKEFTEMQSEMVDVLGNGMVLKKVIRAGSGECPTPKSLLTYHYASFCVGEGIECGEPFDSSYLRDQPDRKRLSVGGLLPGIETALSTMQSGEESYFLIHPDWAYGKRGVPPRILADCWILFSAKLIRWNDCSNATEYERMTEAERKEAPWDKLKAALENLRKVGVKALQQGDLDQAERMFKKGRNWLLHARVENEEVEQEFFQFAGRFYRNLVITLFKRGGDRNYKVAMTCINDTLQLKNLDPKILSQCHFYKGSILRRWGEHERAKAELLLAKKLMKDEAILNELALLEKDVQKSKADFKEFAKRAIKAKVEDLPATGGAKMDNEEEDVATCLRNLSLSETVDPNTVDLIISKIKDFRANDKERQLFLPDFLMTVDLVKVVQALARLYGLGFEADDEVKTFKLVKYE